MKYKEFKINLSQWVQGGGKKGFSFFFFVNEMKENNNESRNVEKYILNVGIPFFLFRNKNMK